MWEIKTSEIYTLISNKISNIEELCSLFYVKHQFIVKTFNNIEF